MTRLDNYTPFVLILSIFAGLAMAKTESSSPTDTSAPDYQAQTTQDPEIPPDELALLVKPLTAEELKLEADAWLALLKVKTRETSLAELAVKQKNKTIEKAQDVQDALQDTAEVLDQVKDASAEVEGADDHAAAQRAKKLASEATATLSDTTEAISEALATSEEVAANEDVQQVLAKSSEQQLNETADSAQKATEKVSRAADRTASAATGGKDDEVARLAAKTRLAVDVAKDALADTSNAVTDAVPQGLEEVQSTDLSESAAAVAALADSEQEDKQDILFTVNELKAQRTALVDKLNVVVDELSLKLGSSMDGAESDLVTPFRLYAEAVSDIAIDVSDTQALYSNVTGWIMSDLGGVRLARNLGKFLLSVLGFWLLGAVLGKIVDKTLRMTRITVELMRSVIVRTVRRSTLLIGFVVGLAAMDINVGPILAVVGAAGFVVAFALQNTLSNFASGIMIMIYRPYDVGDMINVGGVTGEARSMNLVTTTIATPDNQLLIVPNNAVWGNTITNITGSATRRVDMIFRISYEDDIEAALRILNQITCEHPLVLDEPEPVIAVQELGEFSVNFVCRPWSSTGDYWQVYREITRSVKERFEQEGLTTPTITPRLARAKETGARPDSALLSG